ncbi:hypothetical protein [Amycolatopsis sp. NPDC058986]|uniref:hypothetical protein n=1 Tax=unclassified Amycolatopsis TaxID=2618356 RepID=UPI0036723A8F
MTTHETRLQRRIRQDFSESDSVQEILRMLADLSRQTGDDVLDTERVHAAIVLVAQGDITRFREALVMSKQDWRDVLVAAGLANEDWRTRLDQELGPVNPNSPTHYNT